MRSTVVALACVAGALGCVHTNAAVLNEGLTMEPICPNGVVVYTDSAAVPGPYTQVALLNSKGDANETSESGMVTSQRKKAAELGANGIIIGQIQEPKAGTKIIGALFGTGASRKGSAMAIHVPSDSTYRTVCAGKKNLKPTRS